MNPEDYMDRPYSSRDDYSRYDSPKYTQRYTPREKSPEVEYDVDQVVKHEPVVKSAPVVKHEPVVKSAPVVKHEPTVKYEGNFPNELMLNKKAIYPIPSSKWDDDPHHLKSQLNEVQVYVDRTEWFKFKPRSILDESQEVYTSSKESSRWLAGSNMNYWSQQLNFAVWLSTAGCGISFDMLTRKDSPEVSSLIRFHIIFTIRRILNALSVPLPGDRTFHALTNHYNMNSYLKLCKEFAVHKNSDFRFIKGANHGLGDVFINLRNGLQKAKDYNTHAFPPQWPGGFFKFGDEGCEAKYGNCITYIKEHETGRQYDWFVPQKGIGLTKSGLSRLNQSIEAFVYCVLGAQVNTRSSIIGDTGSAQETQRVFLQLFESAIIEMDIPKSIQRYQLAIQEAKVKLDTAVAVGCWLFPSRLVVNNNSVLLLQQ